VERSNDCKHLSKYRLNQSNFPTAYFWWLNRVPAQTFYILGMVVGVTLYENSQVYTGNYPAIIIEISSHFCIIVDDGSAVIDCNISITPKTGSPALTPVSRVGAIVYVTGRLEAHISKYTHEEDRVFRVDELQSVQCSVEEPKHWLKVLDLHKTYWG
jgi:hypothetical protein